MFVTESVAVRRFQPEDEAFVIKLAEEAFSEFASDAARHTLGIVRRMTTLVAERGPRRVGFASVTREHDGAVILQAIAVVARERGRGVGQRLMQAVEHVARARGAERLELCTADYNVAALDLFYKRGFRLVRRRERYYEYGQTACVLVKQLDTP